MLLAFLRIWLPAIVVIAGVVVMIAGGGDDVSLEGGAGIIGAGLAIWLMNALFRVGMHNDRDRDDEDAARDYLDAHGYWPDEAPEGAPEPRAATPNCPAEVPRAPSDPGAARRPGVDRGAARPRRPL